MRYFISIAFFLCSVFFYEIAYSLNVKEIKWLNGNEFKINKNTNIVADYNYNFEIDLFINMLKRIADFDGNIIGNMSVLPLKSDNSKKAIVIGMSGNPLISPILKEAGIDIRGDEGYGIVINENSLLISFNSRKGLLYALSTLEEIFLISQIRYSGKQVFFSVPGLIINDFPSINIRALHLPMSDLINLAEPEVVKTLFKRIIDRAVYFKFNTIFFSINNAMFYSSHPEVSIKKAFSKAEILELLTYAKKRHFEIIPEVQTLGHQEWMLAKSHPELMLEGNKVDGNLNNFLTYNPDDKNVYKIILEIFEEVISVFQPKYFHIGHDEAVGIRIYDEPKSYQMFAKDISILHDFLASKGIKTMIWGDMLKKDQNGSVKSIYKAIDLIPKDVIIIDWIYGPQKDYPSVKYFMGKNFNVMGATFKNEKGIETYSNFIKNIKPKPFGIVATLWYYLPAKKIELIERLIEVSGKNYW